MQQGFVAERSLGYGQFVAGAIDASVLLSTIFATGIPEGTSLVMITPEAQAVRWRDDGIAPTTTVGHPLAVGAQMLYSAHSIKNLRFIGQVAGAVLNCTFYAQGGV